MTRRDVAIVPKAVPIINPRTPATFGTVLIQVPITGNPDQITAPIGVTVSITIVPDISIRVASKVLALNARNAAEVM